MTYSSDKNLWREIGNVLTQWELLPNDLRADPDFQPLQNALIGLYNRANLLDSVTPTDNVFDPPCDHGNATSMPE